WYLKPQNLPPGVDMGGMEATIGYRPAPDSGTFSYAAHAALVAVDSEVGDVEILDYVIVEDGGKLVNPMIVDGQIFGGFAQGHGPRAMEISAIGGSGPPASVNFRRLYVAGPDRSPSSARRPHGDAGAAYRIRRERYRWGRRYRPARRDHQRGKRRAAAARGG